MAEKNVPHIILAADEGRKDPFNWIYDDPMGLCSKDLQLNIVHIVKDDKDRAKGLEVLKKFDTDAQRLFKDRFVIHTKLIVSKEGIGPALVEYSNDLKPKLLVIGASGSGLFKLHILGSVSDYVQHHCQCPVVIVKTTHKGEGKRTQPLQVAVAVDHNVHSDHAVEWVLTETNMPKKINISSFTCCEKSYRETRSTKIFSVLQTQMRRKQKRVYNEKWVSLF